MFVRYFLYASVVSLVCVQISTAMAAYGYRDVAPDARFGNALEFLKSQNVLSKEAQSFRPNATATRAEFLKMLYAVFPPQDKTCRLNGAFKDVQSWQWYAVEACYQYRDTLLPSFDNRFAPNENISRIDALTALIKHSGVDVSGYSYKNLETNYDLLPNTKYEPYVAYAISKNIFPARKKDHFGVWEPIMRKNAADLVYRMHDVLKDNNGEAFDEPLPQKDTQTGSKIEIDLSKSIHQRAFEQKVSQIQKLLSQVYVKSQDLDYAQSYEKALQAFVNANTDEFTRYMPAKESKDLEDTLHGEFEGIGAVITMTAKGPKIESILPDSPSFNAGLNVWDIIKKVDGESIEDLDLQDVVSKIRGPKGTTVTLTVQRDEEVLDIEITRDVVDLKEVQSKLVQGMGYIRLTNFGDNSVSAMKNAITELQNQGANKLVLDLRNNPGGYLDAAVSIASIFLPEDTLVVYTKDNEQKEQVYKTKASEVSARDMEIAVMVNNASASASEILAGALRDQKNIPIIWEQTYGKGSAQQIYRFSDASSVKVTTDYWYLPNDETIQDKGIVPDYKIELDREAYLQGDDAQLDKAIDILR